MEQSLRLGEVETEDFWECLSISMMSPTDEEIRSALDYDDCPFILQKGTTDLYTD